MKKIISLSLTLMLLLGILAVPAMADEAQVKKVGTLSYLNLTEEQSLLTSPMKEPLRKLLTIRGVLKAPDRPVSVGTSIFINMIKRTLCCWPLSPEKSDPWSCHIIWASI